jgi:hypothetical protein
MALIGGPTVVTFAAVVALLTIFAKPLWQGADALFSKVAIVARLQTL